MSQNLKLLNLVDSHNNIFSFIPDNQLYIFQIPTEVRMGFSESERVPFSLHIKTSEYSFIFSKFLDFFSFFCGNNFQF